MRLVHAHFFASLLSASVLDSSARIFECLGFESVQIIGSVLDVVLRPPDINPTSPSGKVARSKLLRAWVELSAWVVEYSKRFGRPPICMACAVYSNY